MIAHKKARVGDIGYGMKAGIEKMYADPQLSTAEDGCPSEFPSEYSEGFGLTDNSFTYTDDFWGMMPNTPTFSKLKLEDPSCKDRLFDGALSDCNNELTALGVVRQDAAFPQKFGVGSSQFLSREDGSILSGIPSSLRQLEDTMELMDTNDIDLDFPLDAENISSKSKTCSKMDSSSFLPSEKDPQERDKGSSKSARKVSNSESSTETRPYLEQAAQTDAQIPTPPPPTRGSKPLGGSQPSKESRWAEQLLSSCASAIASRNIVRTQHLMWVLNDLASLAGDANQRLAAYGLKALFSRITGSVTAASAYHHRIPPPASLAPRAINRALIKFHDVNPWHQIVYTATNGVLMEAFEGKNRIHVVDIGISQGTQWPTFLEALATRPSGSPELFRLTVVDDPLGTPFRSTPTPSPDAVPDVELEFKTRLDRFAKVVGLNMELRVLSLSLEDITLQKLELRSDEALGICAQFRVHRLNESTTHASESSSGSTPTVSPRGRFLRFLYDLHPQVMILNENDVDHQATDFLARFQKVADYQWRFLDSMSSSFKGRDCEERQIIEYELAMGMLNNIACEGAERIERNDTHTGWAMRMQRAGFRPDLPADDIMENVRLLLRKYDANWDFMADENCVVLQWKQQPVTFCSIWR